MSSTTSSNIRDIPFLLPDGNNIFHTNKIEKPYSIYSYYLIAFIYQYVNTYKLQESNQLDIILRGIRIRKYPDCVNNSLYDTLVSVCADIATKYGILTTTNEDIKISQPEGVNSSYWNHEIRNLESYKPIYHEMIINSIIQNTPTIVTGGTGTGKTDAVPKMYYYYYRIIKSVDYFLNDKRQYAPNVILAFPRKVLAENTFYSYNRSLGYLTSNEELIMLDNVNDIFNNNVINATSIGLDNSTVLIERHSSIDPDILLTPDITQDNNILTSVNNITTNIFNTTLSDKRNKLITSLNNTSPISLLIGDETKTYIEDGKIITKIAERKIISNIKPSLLIGTSESLCKSIYTDLPTPTLVMIDEFHEHDLKSDILFSLSYNKKAMIVFITATPSESDEKIFKRLFKTMNRIHIAGTKAPEIKTISMISSSENTKINFQELRRITETYINKLSRGESLLVFLPSIDGVNKLSTDLRRKQYSGVDYTVVEFHSKVALKAKEEIKKIEKDERVVIIATQAAESSITFPTLSYVIDTGLETKIIINPLNNYRTYVINPIIQYINYYQYLQRRGRVGRTKKGVVVLLYDPNKLSKKTTSVLDGNVTTLVLLIKKYNLSDEDLFCDLTPESREILKVVRKLTDSVNINNVPLERLKSIYWIESLKYIINPSISNEDKDLYNDLWVAETITVALSILRKFKQPSFIPRRRLQYINTSGRFARMIERETSTIIDIPISGFITGRAMYDQITLSIAIGV